RTEDTVRVPGQLQVNFVLDTGITDSGRHYIKVSNARNLVYSDISPPSDNHACVGFDEVTNGYYFGTCPSSIRYKTNVHTLSFGLDTIKRLRPVRFDWLSNGKPSVGLIAEEVNNVEPLLSVKNKHGIVESVNYNGVTVALVNAVKEQQSQIEAQQKLIEQQNKTIRKQDQNQNTLRSEINSLKALVCPHNASAPLCLPQGLKKRV